MPLIKNGVWKTDHIFPEYDNNTVWECKWEIDSHAAFLQISADYFTATGDADFFARHHWISAVRQVLSTANEMKEPTYQPDGLVNESPYRFNRLTVTAEDTMYNGGRGAPVREGIGLVRSGFRPSDDICIFQYFIPGNMMFSAKLQAASEIAQRIGDTDLASAMQQEAVGLRSAIERFGTYEDPIYGKVYAYEIDGYGSINAMDDANIPSLLSAPFFGYLDINDPVYQNTRRKILSTDNPYYMHGPAISGVGGPHDGPGWAWPMSSIVRILTSNDDDEIADTLKGLLNSTAGLGLMHESVRRTTAKEYTRSWFAWANGLFGQMIIDLERRKPEILSRSFQ